MNEDNKQAAACSGCDSGNGCAGRLESPWPPHTSWKTTSAMGLPAFLGAFALLRKAPFRLPLFASIWVILGTYVRKLVCCRCDYFGTDCCTIMGVLSAMLFKKDDEHQLTSEAFYLDFGLVGLSMLFPLPQVKKMGPAYLLTYISAVVTAGISMKTMACRYCPNTVCFMNPRFRDVR